MSKYKAWADKIQMFRFHKNFHLGLGDIRLSRADGDELMRDLMEAAAALRELEAERDRLRGLIKDAVEWADRHGKEPWWLDAFRAELEGK